MDKMGFGESKEIEKLLDLEFLDSSFWIYRHVAGGTCIGMFADLPHKPPEPPRFYRSASSLFKTTRKLEFIDKLRIHVALVLWIKIERVRYR